MSSIKKNMLCYLAIAILGSVLFLVCNTEVVFIGLFIFFSGQAWIILSEWLYLSIVLKWVQPILVLNRIFLINCLTTLIGFVLLILARVQEKTNLPCTLNSMIRQAMGDNYYHFLLLVHFVFLSIFFSALYLISAYVQGYLLIRINREYRLLEEKSIMKHSFIFNLLSYTGILLFVFIWFMNIHGPYVMVD